MQQCSPIEMRKNLEAVESLKLHMIDFVAVPVTSEENKQKLIKQAFDALETMNEMAKEE